VKALPGKPVQIEGLDQGIEVTGLVFDAIGDVRLVGFSHSDEIGGNAARVRSDMWQDITPEVRGSRIAVLEQHHRSFADFDIRHLFAKEIPLGRYGSPEDLAEVVALLASDRGKWMTGGIINVDGGMTAR